MSTENQNFVEWLHAAAERERIENDRQFFVEMMPIRVRTIKPFHQWKREYLAKSSVMYPREWYYTKYGQYCNRQRKKIIAESNTSLG